MISPLRYPGGKARLTPTLRGLLSLNKLESPVYVEPYAGGAGIALGLLESGTVSRAYINDLDRAIYAFWWAILHESEALLEKIAKCDVSVKEWRLQKKVMDSKETQDLFDLGFATFFLNRTSRSGILKGSGVIGGYEQKGDWKIDARFYRETMIGRIKKVAAMRDRISLHNLDAIEFVKEVQSELPEDTLIYFDPPYYEKGQRLYQNNYEPDDHEAVADFIRNDLNHHWIVSYDDVPQIRALYKGQPSRKFSLSYTAARRYEGGEIMFFSHDLKIPRGIPIS